MSHIIRLNDLIVTILDDGLVPRRIDGRQLTPKDLEDLQEIEEYLEWLRDRRVVDTRKSSSIKGFSTSARKKNGKPST